MNKLQQDAQSSILYQYAHHSVQLVAHPGMAGQLFEGPLKPVADDNNATWNSSSESDYEASRDLVSGNDLPGELDILQYNEGATY